MGEDSGGEGEELGVRGSMRRATLWATLNDARRQGGGGRMGGVGRNQIRASNVRGYEEDLEASFSA